MAKAKLQHVGIIGKRWFDKVNGNTYFSAEIFVNGKKVHKIPREYGYGDHYVDVATDWLEKNGYIKRERYSSGAKQVLHAIAREQGFELDRSAVDVPRKKDL